MAKRKKKKQTTDRERLIELLNKPGQTFESLCDGMDMAPSKVRALLVELERVGVKIQEDDEIFSIVTQNRLGPEDLEHEHFMPSGVSRIGLISDTHLGSHYQQLTYLKEFYARAIDLGVTRFYHSGDMCAGDGRVYAGQENEIFAHGLDHNVEYAAEHYPKHKGVVTYFITGNHDLAWWKRGGVDIGNIIASKRPDMVYLGQCGAYDKVTREGHRIYLHHPDGGRSYAVSYKLQKVVEAMTPEERPQIFSSGHLHQISYFKLLGVRTFQPGCFESQNTYLKRKALYPAIGGLVLELFIEKNEIRSIKFEEITWDVPLLKDF